MDSFGLTQNVLLTTINSFIIKHQVGDSIIVFEADTCSSVLIEKNHLYLI